jgi:hypothetical protein
MIGHVGNAILLITRIVTHVFIAVLHGKNQRIGCAPSVILVFSEAKINAGNAGHCLLTRRHRNMNVQLQLLKTLPEAIGCAPSAIF